MKRGLDWYKREQRAMLDGVRAARMTDRQIAIYNLALDLIYDGGGSTPDDPKHIASYTANLGAAAVRATIQQLVDMGKLYRVGGNLHQKRAETEAKTRQNLSETRAKTGRLGGVSSGVSRRKSNETNDMTEANASSKHEAEKEKREIREEKNPPNPPEGGVVALRIASDLDAEFDRVWSAYPRKVGHGQAKRAWIKARRKTDFETIAGPLREFIRVARGTEKDKVPHFSTWLNGERWLDDQTHARNGPRKSTDDLRELATISPAEDVARLFGGIQRKAIAQ